MRVYVDGDLRFPYSTWIDPNVPLSDKVRLIPRAIAPGHDLLAFVSAVVSFGAAGAVLGYFAWRWHGAGAGVAMPVILALVSVVLWAVPFVLGRRWWRTRSAASEEKRNRLRQGILLGIEGMLVRMEPDSCYVVTWDRYLGAKHFHHSSGGTLFQVETLDGPIDFPSHWLRTTLSGFEKAVEQFRPVTGRPKVIPPIEREHRVDPEPQRRLLKLVFLFLAGGGIVLASLIGMNMAEAKSPAHSWSSLGVLIGLLWTFAAVPYAFWTLYRLSVYNCPECGEKLPRADELRPNVVFYCMGCGINWDTKMSERRMPHGPG